MKETVDFIGVILLATILIIALFGGVINFIGIPAQKKGLCREKVNEQIKDLEKWKIEFRKCENF
jgi:hypothetical protein